MRRREFIGLLSSAAAFVWSIAAPAQQTPVIEVLNSEAADDYSYLVASFQQGLTEAGVVVGSDAALQFRWAEGDYERLPALAADLVRRGSSVIAALGAPAT